MPADQAPTRHPRRGGVGTLHPGERLTVRFAEVGLDGTAMVRLGAVRLSVPFGVPGEDAVVEVVRGGRRAQGRLVALLRKSADVVQARCPHFGRCGGCQWQHLLPEAQRRFKTRLVGEYLKEHAGVRRELVRQTVGGEAWAYRNVLRAVFGERDSVAVVGFHAGGTQRVLDIAECPVQHPANEAILRAARGAARTLGLPVYDRQSGRGLLRGVLGLVSFATGQALMTWSTAAPLPDPTAVVHAVLDRVPGLVGILNTVQSRPTLDLLGSRLRLLWGRDSIEEEIAGFRLKLRPGVSLPANPRGMAVLVDAVRGAAGPKSDEVVIDLTAATPLFALALAASAEAAFGVSPGRREAIDAREAAAHNGVTNVAFYARDPRAVLERLTARKRPSVALLDAEGPGLEAAVVTAVAAAGIPRVVYTARSLATCAGDIGQWVRAGYAVQTVQPVDLLPQTSHVHLVVALRRV
ncbi:MAG: 23S rRNA (uracil(1939)-C(5))-methyltransferase RlmD [bacterium]